MTCQSAALGNNTAAGLPLFMLGRSERGPPYIPETGVIGQHGPLDISYDNTPGCVM